MGTSRVRLGEITAAARVSFIYCQRDELHDCDEYRVLCLCRADSGWVTFDSQAVRDCFDPVQFVAGTLRQSLNAAGCTCDAATPLFASITNSIGEHQTDLTISNVVESVHQIKLGGRKHCGSATCTTCDPMERMVDGKAVRECLELMEASAHTQYPSAGGRDEYPGLWHWLTAAQKDAARSAWSAALRAKVKEAEEKERRQIVCDDDRWEA